VQIRRPRIVVTVQSPEHAANEEVAWRKNDRYFEAVHRHDGDVIVLDENSSAEDRAGAFAVMDGLLLSGGADLDPALYGEEPHPTTVVEPGRDALEQAAFAAAEERRTPIFGVCRGMQAVNVFRGGSLVQDIEGHTSSPYPAPEATSHDLEIEAGTRLAEVLGEGTATVNTYHHQAIRPEQVGRGLRISGYSEHPDGDLVEAFEDEDPDRWLMAVQSHPERTEFTSPEFERLWAAFLDAARDYAANGGAPGAAPRT
jgi:putative glutamine amidotransferase